MNLPETVIPMQNSPDPRIDFSHLYKERPVAVKRRWGWGAGEWEDAIRRVRIFGWTFSPLLPKDMTGEKKP
jgi:hypothetical protein